MTALPYFLPTYGEATTLSGMLSSAQSVYILRTHHRFIDWHKLLPILITFLLISFIAVLFVVHTTETHLKTILGITLTLMSIYFLFINGTFQIRPTMKLQISMGTISGMMGGLFGMQGPPAVLYFLSITKDKNIYLAMAQSYFLIGNIAMTIYRWHFGFLTPCVWRNWIFSLVGVAFGSFIGKVVFDRISSDTLRKIVYIYMGISGLVAIFS